MTKKNLFIKTLGMMGLVLISVFGVKAQTPLTLIAHYPFNNTLASSVGSFGSAVIGTAGCATLGSSSVCTDNVNNFSSGLYTPTISSSTTTFTSTTLSSTIFQIDFTINLTNLPSVDNAPLLIISTFRHIGLLLNQSGQLRVLYNNYMESSSANGITLTPGTNYDIQLKYINGLTTLNVNNQTYLSVTLPSLITNTDRKILLGDNPGFPSLSAAIQGCYSNLKVYTAPTYTWTGTTSTDWATATNWNTGIVPPNDVNVIIPSTSITNFPVATDITIGAGTTILVRTGGRLSVTGVLTNNGTLMIENGATLVQGSTSTLAGTNPVYNVKQNVTGANDGTNPNGRFWYIGSPVSLSSSSVLFSGLNPVVKTRDEPNNTWTTLLSGTPENLMVGRGYYIRRSAGATINFTGGVINNHPTASPLQISLTRTANSFAGFNLVCNPYPSYLDWDLVGRSQVENTMWYRTAVGTTTTMVFETYVANSGGIGTNLSGNTATKLIPPMQAFWVRVSSGNTSGTITMDNSMRSHFASISGSTAGLRSTVNDFNLFLRMNLVQDDKKDQIIVYVNENSTNQYDAFDGEKMMQSDLPQFYTTTSGKKIVINGLSAENTQQTLPITMELTTTGDHQFMVEDLEIESGNIWLEDKLEGTFQLLEPGFGYKFFANAGLSNDRFVLHLKLKDLLSPSTPNVESANEMEANHAIVYAENTGLVVVKIPATDNFATDVQIYDAAGRTFFSGTLKSLESKIQLEQAKGIYYVSLTSVNGVEVRKVFID